MAPQRPQTVTEPMDSSSVVEPLEEIELDYMPREDSVIGVDPITAVGSGQIELPEVIAEDTEIPEMEE